MLGIVNYKDQIRDFDCIWTVRNQQVSKYLDDCHTRTC